MIFIILYPLYVLYHYCWNEDQIPVHWNMLEKMQRGVLNFLILLYILFWWEMSPYWASGKLFQLIYKKQISWKRGLYRHTKGSANLAICYSLVPLCLGEWVLTKFWNLHSPTLSIFLFKHISIFLKLVESDHLCYCPISFFLDRHNEENDKICIMSSWSKFHSSLCLNIGHKSISNWVCIVTLLCTCYHIVLPMSKLLPPRMWSSKYTASRNVISI